MFFSKLDREEFDALKKDLFFFSAELGRLTKRIESLELVESSKIRRDINFDSRISNLAGRMATLEAKSKLAKKGKK